VEGKVAKNPPLVLSAGIVNIDILNLLTGNALR
jgi:hypothetical protein